MTDPPQMPAGLRLARTTPEFTDATTPAGLRRAHRVAPGLWGQLQVREGGVRFVFEDPPASIHDLVAGDAIDIPPGIAHRVEPGLGCRFVVEFHEPRPDHHTGR